MHSSVEDFKSGLTNEKWVIRTAQGMEIPYVVVHSTIDRDVLHVRLVDEAVCIGEAPNNQS